MGVSVLRKRLEFWSAATFCAAAIVGTANAQVLIGTCTITVQQAGTITTNTAINSLSSKNAGGSSARATVSTASLLCGPILGINCYRISAPPPASFASSPSSGNTGTSFATVFRLNGSADLPGATPQGVLNGSYNMEVDLTATKASSIFPAGIYRGEVTVRCE